MRTKNWSLVLLTIVLGATLLSQTQFIPLPTSITVAPTDPRLNDINFSQDFTAHSGDTGEVFPLRGVKAIQLDGGQNTCAVLSDRTVHCWPSTFYYPGVGPLPVAGLSEVTAVSSGRGGGHICVLLADTTVKCWGPNFYGELGDGTTTPRDTPVTVIESNGSPLTNVTAISTGSYHTCALIIDTTVKCWGDNGISGQGTTGQLGDPATIHSFSATPVPVSGLGGAVAISAGNNHTCALIGDATVRCWGGNGFGELGDPASFQNYRATPVFVAGLTGAKSISTEGFHFTCALLLDETVKCWGYNDVGQLGNGSKTDSTFPVTVTGLSTAKTLSVGQSHVCATLGDMTVKCWGANPYGNLGNGTATNSSVPVTVSGLSTAVAVSAGKEHSCALLSDSTVNCWGINITGQLGTGSSNPFQSTTPVATAPLGRVAWTSSDPSVAIMDAFGGVAYSAAFGITTITATYGPLTASTTLTVGDFAPKITVPSDITAPVDMAGGGIATVTFTATATGSPAPTVTCSIPNVGTISSPYAFPVGQTTVTCTAQNSLGSDSKSFTVTVTPIASRSLSISDVTVLEGDTGVTSAIFRVILSAPSSVDVTVTFATQNGTASGAIDYTITGRTVRFTSGQTTQDVPVSVIGDTAIEPNETFFGVLSNPVNATIADGQGVATITDDDRWLFTVTPSVGPEGTFVRADSVKKCPAPAGARAWTAAVAFDQKHGGVSMGSALVFPDGSWSVSAQIPASAKPGQASLRASCFDATGVSTQHPGYEPAGFYVEVSNFTLTPTTGQAGTQAMARSVTPCRKPASANGQLWKAYVIWTGPSWRELIGEAIVQADGSWLASVRIPRAAGFWGTLKIDAECGGPHQSQPYEFLLNGPIHEYAPQTFEVIRHRFRLTPARGPAGTIVQATSIDPCPFPSNRSLPWMVTLEFRIAGNGFDLASVPVASDGSWTMAVRMPFLASGSEVIRATCLEPNDFLEYQNETFFAEPGEFTATPLSGPGGTVVTATSVSPCPRPDFPQQDRDVTLYLNQMFVGRAPIRPDGSWSVAGPIWLQVTPGNYSLIATCTYLGGPNGNGDIYNYPPKSFTVR